MLDFVYKKVAKGPKFYVKKAEQIKAGEATWNWRVWDNMLTQPGYKVREATFHISNISFLTNLVSYKQCTEWFVKLGTQEMLKIIELKWLCAYVFLISQMEKLLLLMVVIASCFAVPESMSIFVRVTQFCTQICHYWVLWEWFDRMMEWIYTVYTHVYLFWHL